MKFIKKWWFPILCIMVGLFVMSCCLWWLNTDDELFEFGACLCMYATLAFLLVIIGCANLLKPKENKEEFFTAEFKKWLEEKIKEESKK